MVEIKNSYEVYKDSGVEWLGQIPEHWEIKRFKFISNIQKGKLPKKIVSINELNLPPYMSMEYLRGGEANQWVLDIDAKIIDEKKTLLLWDGSNAGEFIKSRKGVISSTVAEIEFKYINHDFVWYYSKFLEIELRKKTIGMGIPHVNGTELKNFSVVVPPIKEQTAIAAFLDDKTAKIDQAIAIKEQQIALLKERKQIIIQEAVTKGLDKTVKYKDSGVEWIGEIPEHWEVIKSQWLFKERKERARLNDIQLTSSQKLGVIPQAEFMQIEGRKVTQVVFNNEIQKHVEVGDFMISMRSFQGGLEYSNYRGCISSAYVSLIPSENVYNGYYKYLLKSQRYIEALQSTSNLVRDGQALRYFNFKQVPLLKIPIYEQKEIAIFIETQSSKIDQAVSIKEQEIEKLKEYKVSLIDAVVTGKVKVV